MTHNCKQGPLSARPLVRAGLAVLCILVTPGVEDSITTSLRTPPLPAGSLGIWSSGIPSQSNIMWRTAARAAASPQRLLTSSRPPDGASQHDGPHRHPRRRRRRAKHELQGNGCQAGARKSSQCWFMARHIKYLRLTISLSHSAGEPKPRGSQRPANLHKRRKRKGRRPVWLQGAGVRLTWA